MQEPETAAPMFFTSASFRSFAVIAALAMLLLTGPGSFAQEGFGSKVPSVTLSTPAIPSIIRGTPGKAELHFHITPGFHVNSNTPSEEYLIPTALRMDAPTDIVVGRIIYPAGQNITLPFAPDLKLNVYSGEFSVLVTVRPLSSVLPGKYALRGRLKYQACDKAACYPPKELPVDFEVRVAKSTHHVRRDPAQSPHIH
jgi:cytochrome c biogenesis DsbD-like protein